VKRLARAAVAIGVALVAVVLLTMWWQTSLIFPAPPRGREPAYPDNLVRTPEATLLYFEGKRVVVWFHGNGEDLADAVPMVSLLRTLGVGVLAVEYPGYGVAGGTPSEQGSYAAAESALSWLRTERGVDDARVMLLGQSLGSGVATEMARRGHGARLVLISPFTSIAEMARRLFPFFPAWFLRHRFDTLSKAPSISLPVLILHGTEDEVVPFSMGEHLARAFPQARLVAIPGGQHNDLLTVHAIPVRDALSPFLKP
jgi:alpha-beta hydrolase superfamily lysophospholipase